MACLLTNGVFVLVFDELFSESVFCIFFKVYLLGFSVVSMIF